VRVLVPTRAAPADRWVGLKKQSAALDGLAPGDALSFERRGADCHRPRAIPMRGRHGDLSEAEFEMFQSGVSGVRVAACKVRSTSRSGAKADIPEPLRSAGRRHPQRKSKEWAPLTGRPHSQSRSDVRD